MVLVIGDIIGCIKLASHESSNFTTIASSLALPGYQSVCISSFEDAYPPQEDLSSLWLGKSLFPILGGLYSKNQRRIYGEMYECCIHGLDFGHDH